MYGCALSPSFCLCGCVADLANWMLCQKCPCAAISTRIAAIVLNKCLQNGADVKNTEHLTAHLTYVFRCYITYTHVCTCYHCHHTYCFYVALSELCQETVIFQPLVTCSSLGHLRVADVSERLLTGPRRWKGNA